MPCAVASNPGSPGSDVRCRSFLLQLSYGVVRPDDPGQRIESWRPRARPTARVPGARSVGGLT
jgi:hypothetical protein